MNSGGRLFKMRCLIICVYCVLSIVPVIHADVYSWLGEDGIKVFSNQKPPDPCKTNIEKHKEFQSKQIYQPLPANNHKKIRRIDTERTTATNQHRLDLILKDMVRKYNRIAEKWAKEDLYQNYRIARIFNDVSTACELRMGGGSEKSINEAKDKYRKAVSKINEIKDCTRYVRIKKHGKQVERPDRTCIESKINIAEALVQQGNIQIGR